MTNSFGLTVARKPVSPARFWTWQPTLGQFEDVMELVCRRQVFVLGVSMCIGLFTAWHVSLLSLTLVCSSCIGGCGLMLPCRYVWCLIILQCMNLSEQPDSYSNSVRDFSLTTTIYSMLLRLGATRTRIGTLPHFPSHLDV